MRTQKIKKDKKNMLIATGIIVFLLICAAVFFFWYNATRSSSQTKNEDSSTENIDYNTPSDEQVEAGQNAKDKSIEEDKESQQNQGLQKSISVSLNATQNDSQIIVDTLIQDVLNNGICTLTVSSGSQQITKTAEVFANPSSSSCQGFSLQKNELPIGNWTIKLTVSSSNQSGTASITLGVR